MLCSGPSSAPHGAQQCLRQQGEVLFLEAKCFSGAFAELLLRHGIGIEQTPEYAIFLGVVLRNIANDTPCRDASDFPRALTKRGVNDGRFVIGVRHALTLARVLFAEYKVASER
jgi:hypothetical protein